MAVCVVVNVPVDEISNDEIVFAPALLEYQVVQSLI